MKTARTLTRLVLASLASMYLLAGPAFAQSPAASPSNPIASPPPPKGGMCAPWSSCVAKGTLAAAVLVLLLLGAGFAYQRRGFDRIEHQQGHPEGVATKKD